MADLSKPPGSWTPPAKVEAPKPPRGEPSAQDYVDLPFELRALAVAALGMSPRPWRAVIGRVPKVRIDILDANGKLVFHCHPAWPHGELTLNWENDVSVILAVINAWNPPSK